VTIPITGCQNNLTIDGATYVLTQDIINSSDSFCMDFQVGNSNITLDCQNHLIDGIDAYPSYGVTIWGSAQINIRNCNITDWYEGVQLVSSSSNNLTNLRISSCNSSLGGYGWTYNTFTGIISENSVYGAFIGGGDNNIFNNSVFRGNHYGMLISNLVNSTITNTQATQNTYGIYMYNNKNNDLNNLTLNQNSVLGLWLDGSDSNTLKNSVISSNTLGINITTGLTGSNILYNNLLNNSANVISSTQIDKWNTSKTTGSRVYSQGTQIGGNYWTDPSGNGYSDVCSDTDRDGFCDTPYGLSPNIIDYLPYSNTYESCSLIGDKGP
jgi:nitrous oxidase accessory protein